MSLATNWSSLSHAFSFFLLHILNLLLQPFNDLLAEVRSLGQFLLHFFVNFDVSLEGLDLRLHLVVFE
jgi:hypothetical protein